MRGTAIGRKIICLAADAGGSSAIEYSLIIGGIALAILVTFTSFSDQLQGVYCSISTGVASLSVR